MVEISKADWKLFRSRLPEWQEHYMERLLREYIEMLSSPGKASDHFWELEKRIKSDRKHPGVILEVRKAKAIWDIADFVALGVIAMEDLEEFSPELIESVRKICERRF